jgi:hypothetical protein
MPRTQLAGLALLLVVAFSVLGAGFFDGHL